MELTGDLSDFALTDILQILALSRKTGTLLLEAGTVAGKIIIEQGRITYACLEPGLSLTDQLVRDNKVNAAALAELRKIGAHGGGLWTLESLLVESGVISPDELEAAVRRYIQSVIGVLVALEKGRFGIDLNQARLVETLAGIKLEAGLDVGEVLLEAAKEKDEQTRRAEAETQILRDWQRVEDVLPVAQPVIRADYQTDIGGEWDEAGSRQVRNGSVTGALKILTPYKPEPAESESGTRDADQPLDSRVGSDESLLDSALSRGGPATTRDHRASLLFSLLAELRSHSFEAEVSLLIMRYASEVATRGILFVVREEEICGLGQFGVESRADEMTPDEKVREIRIPFGANTVFDGVVRTGQPFIGSVPAGYWHSELLRRIGGNGTSLSAFALPLVCQDRPIFIFYGDNYPGVGELSGLDELVALVNQASVVLEKIVLERLLSEIQSRMG